MSFLVHILQLIIHNYLSSKLQYQKAYLEKKKRALFEEWSIETVRLEEGHKTTRSKEVKQELEAVTSKLKLAEATSLAKEVMFAKQVFEYTDKCSRQSTHILIKSREKAVLAETMTSQDNIEVTELKDRLKLLTEFYNNLHKIQEPPEENLKDVLNNINIPELSEEHRQVLEKGISMVEIEAALQKMQIGKTAEPDGLSVEFYSTFQVDLMAYSQELFCYCFDQREVPPSWCKPNLVLIPKRDKDLRYLVVYHPISMLNIDYKILAHIFASRLNQIMS